jgi:HemY protein
VAAQDNNAPANSPAAAPVVEPAAPPAPTAPPPEPSPVTAAPLFRQRQDLPKVNPPLIPAVIPIIRPPDDPGIDDEPASDEFADQLSSPPRQAGGWRGFLSRWGG